MSHSLYEFVLLHLFVEYTVRVGLLSFALELTRRTPLSNTALKTICLAKKPINGGTPINEKIVIAKVNDNITVFKFIYYLIY